MPTTYDFFFEKKKYISNEKKRKKKDDKYKYVSVKRKGKDVKIESYDHFG
jgi:hypothetical protein